MSCHATCIMYGVWDIFIVHQQLRFTQPLDFDNRVISNFLVASSINHTTSSKYLLCVQKINCPDRSEWSEQQFWFSFDKINICSTGW